MDLPLALGAEGHTHVGAETASQRVLDAAHFGCLPHPLLETWPPDRRATPAHPVLDVARRAESRRWRASWASAVATRGSSSGSSARACPPESPPSCSRARTPAGSLSR